jgi:N-methylhydantoinase A
MLLAFGGAGPLHAPAIARDLGMAGVVVPLYPGVYSALGLLISNVTHDFVQSKLAPLAAITPQEIEAEFARLETQARTELDEDGFAADATRIERALDLRYAGQGYEITLPCPAQTPAADGGKDLRTRFDALHQTMFGHMAPEEPVEIVSYRVRGVGLVRAVEMPRFKPNGTPLGEALRATRPVRFAGASVPCPVYGREHLDVGISFSGPAVIDQLDCTTLVLPGQEARVDEWKNLLVTEA